MYHIECHHNDRLIDIEAKRFTTKRDAAIALAEVVESAESWRIDLQARFDAQIANDYRSMVIDDADSSDAIAEPRRIAPRYVYQIAKCSGRKCNH